MCNLPKYHTITAAYEIPATVWRVSLEMIVTEDGNHRVGLLHPATHLSLVPWSCISVFSCRPIWPISLAPLMRYVPYHHTGNRSSGFTRLSGFWLTPKSARSVEIAHRDRARPGSRRNRIFLYLDGLCLRAILYQNVHLTSSFNAVAQGRRRVFWYGTIPGWYHNAAQFAVDKTVADLIYFLPARRVQMAARQNSVTRQPYELLGLAFCSQPNYFGVGDYRRLLVKNDFYFAHATTTVLIQDPAWVYSSSAL